MLIAVYYFVLNHTIFGRYIYAICGNAESAKLAGLSVQRIKLQVFILGNILFAISAFILASRLNSGQDIAGVGFEMQVIAAVILGGVSLTSGVGTLRGSSYWYDYTVSVKVKLYPPLMSRIFTINSYQKPYSTRGCLQTTATVNRVRSDL